MKRVWCLWLRTADPLDFRKGGNSMRNTKMMDMTHGPLLGNILLFSLPLMVSNVLQLLFNASDVVIVGQFAGYASLAAVSSTMPIINLFINLLMGLSVGVNVAIARYLGLTGHERQISRLLHTAVTVALTGGTLLGIVGIISSDWLLGWIAVPADVQPLALIYMRIYFIGTPFTMLYNYGAAAVRASGDTRRPLIFLLISGVINICLNLLAVVVMQQGVVGVAVATVVSQAISAALILLCLFQMDGELHFSWKNLCMDKRGLIDMAQIGIPAGIQSCLFSLSNIVIQGAINSYGSIVMAGSGAAGSIENFLYVAMNSFHLACQTFVSQNMGAGEHKRIKRVVRICLFCTLILGITQSVLVIGFAHPLLMIYNRNPAVIEQGVLRLGILAATYVIFGLSDVLVGAIRGCGLSIAPVVVNLLGTCVFRLIWVGLIDTTSVGVEWIYFSYPISWSLLLIAYTPFWIYVWRKKCSHQTC